MKLISLNIWAGRQHEALGEFLQRYSKEIDIFCFQEVFHHGKGIASAEASSILKSKGYDPDENNMEIFSDLEKLLPGFKGYLAPPDSMEESLAIFVKKDVVIDKTDYFFALEQSNGDPRTLGIPLQYIEFKNNGKQYTICNFHGWWVAGSKSDTPERLVQSQNIKKFLHGIVTLNIICGDFNLLPSTESIAIIDQGMKNLIKEHNITSTRSHLYTKTSEKFADYTIVSPEIKVNEFKVLPDVVSDHLAMYLDFE